MYMGTYPASDETNYFVLQRKVTSVRLNMSTSCTQQKARQSCVREMLYVLKSYRAESIGTSSVT